MHHCSEDIGFLIKQISGKMQAHADAEMKCTELTYSQFHVLGYLARHGMEAPQKEIEEFLGVSHPTVAGLVKRLESKGFVATRADEQDRRTKLVRLTDKALALGDHMREERRKGEEKLRGSLTPAEAEELLRLLKIVYANILSEEGTSSNR
ncbi:MAG: MarR family transcriptional regulator [Mogibacterium sp.]|nr:MarR family transcriptional regulator [Mogibacterium sp.]